MQLLNQSKALYVYIVFNGTKASLCETYICLAGLRLEKHCFFMTASSKKKSLANTMKKVHKIIRCSHKLEEKRDGNRDNKTENMLLQKLT